ncbi:MAG: hypothetical protein COZ18_05405 [Flexibacter sp. CG_4_10_14_3_um_filter_32_15]|nr:MAG: hypothetical protein COZ18_05405 [Flexibacter sp. CG_4_10_14_3_um_filter_32_15]
MKRTAFYLALSLILTGLVFLVLAVQSWHKEQIRQTKYERTLGRVVQIKPLPEDKSYPVIGFYALDSQKIMVHAKHEVSRFSSYELGEVVEIYYDIINPDDTHIVRYEWFWMSFLSITGIAFVGGGVIWGLLIWLRANRRNWLLEKGSVLEGVIQAVVQDPQIMLQDQPAFIILCEWKRDENSGVLLFKSEPLAYDPTELLEERETLPIYIDLENPENYWIDISFLNEEKVEVQTVENTQVTTEDSENKQE